MIALTLEAITLRRGGRLVLDGVHVAFAAGRLTAVIGPNGAGKSSMLEVAAGLLKPERGEVRLSNTPLSALRRQELAQRRAYLPQRVGVDWPISVERVVALGLLPQLPAFGGLPAALLPAIERALAECDLLALRDRPATDLSGGELARVLLARAIVGDPELLIVDEPTADLDPRHAIDAMRRTGLDISGHTSRRLDAAILDWADIVITMEGAHVVDLVEEWPDHARWAVTMEGAVRVAETHEPTGTLDGPGIRDWATAAQTLLVPSILDRRNDVADPMGRSNREFRRTAELLADRISRLLDVWFPATAAR